MFKPNFKYTNKIVQNLTAIAEARAIILTAPMVPKWEVSLRKEALLKSAHSSTAIEGNPLSYSQVSALAEGREVMVRRKDRQEVLNYITGLETIPNLSKRNPFTKEDLLELHKIITKDTLENPKDEGAIRDRQVYVVNRATGEVVFKPPTVEDVPLLTDELLDSINSGGMEDLNPVIEAGIVHYELVRIHPFIDGNGRTARVMASLVLYKRGFDIKRFFALDDYYDSDRRSYYEALRKVDQETLDLTGWLEYFTDGVAACVDAVRDKVIGLSRDIKVLKDRGQTALTDRQMRIVQHMVEKGRLTNAEVREMFGLSNRAAMDEIDKLLKQRIIRRKGKGRSTHYILE